MKLNNRLLKTLKWEARILALAVLLFGLPFYFGYGNPLPFIDPESTVWDNTWLCVFPLMFIGLALGWKFERIGGFLVALPILIGSIIGLIVEQDLPLFMPFPVLIGVLYIIVGYAKVNILIK